MGNIEILIVEDDPITAEYIKSLLKANHYSAVSITGEGEQAIQAAREENPDLILMDIFLSGTMNGVEAARTIREEQDIPIIFMTANSDRDTVQAALATEPYGYLNKPINETDLLLSLEITLRRHAADLKLAELLRSSRDWHDIFEAISHPCLILRPDHTILEANRAALAITDLNRESIKNRNCYELFHGRDAGSPPKECPLSKLLTTEKAETFDMAVEAFNAFFIVSCTPILDARGRIEKIIHIATDITARKKAEVALQERQSHLDSLFRAAPSGIGILVDRSFVELNDRLCELTGYCREELMGKDARMLYESLEEYQRVGMDMVNQMREQVIGTIETRWRRKDGVLLDILLGATPVTPGKFNGSYTFTATDITEQKRVTRENKKLEDQLRQSQKMEAIGQLAGGIAHDFNNLLTAIIGNVSLALMDLPPSHPLYKSLDEVMKAGESAAALVKQLLAFSRKQSISPRLIRMDHILVNVHKMLARVIGENISLTIDCGDDLYTIRADPSQIEQIIFNLAINARDAMPGGGKLIIETRNAELDDSYCRLDPGAVPGSYVMLAVTDTGTGMTREVRERIFEPFFTTKPKGKGTGLGLATLYGTVKQNGGYINVYSEPDIGTTFRIYFPAVFEKEETVGSSDDMTVLPEGNETILLVEDDAAVLSLSTMVLQKLGYRLYAFSSGTQALQALNGLDGKPHLLLTDMVLPGINGHDLAREIQKHYPSMKVIFSSGYAEDAILHRGRQEEDIYFIGKPYTPLSLAKKVREVLDE